MLRGIAVRRTRLANPFHTINYVIIDYDVQHDLSHCLPSIYNSVKIYLYQMYNVHWRFD